MRKSRYMGPSLTMFGKTRFTNRVCNPWSVDVGASVMVGGGIWCGRVYRRVGEAG
jgi:hypothetical protein